MKKTVKVTEDVWNKLWELRLKFKVRTLNDVIKELISRAK